MGEARRSIQELGDLSDRRALVAGGGGHIGRAAVEALRESGARVVVCDLVEGDGDESIRCDLRDEGEARGAVREAARRLGGLDILVHCAALVGSSAAPGWAAPFEKQTVEAWSEALLVNVGSAFVLVQEARDTLVASGRGSVILFGSVYGIVAPDPGLYGGTDMVNPVAYGASKGGVIQLMRYLATTLAPTVRVNAISPGGIAREQPSVFRERYELRTPLARMGSEEDIKGAVAYLAGDLSAYVTGHNLVVDGGWTTW